MGDIKAIHASLDGGIDQSTHRAWVQPPGAIDALNVRFRQNGGVEKRPGVQPLAFEWADGQPFMGGGKLYGFRGQLVMTDGYRIGSMATVNGQTAIVPSSKVPEAVPSMDNISTTPYIASSFAQYDIAATSDGTVFYAWMYSPQAVPLSGDIFYTVQDKSGAEIRAASPATSGSQRALPQLVAVGNAVVMFYRDNGANIFYRLWDNSALTWSAELTARADNATAGDFSICTDGTDVFLAYRTSANLVTVRRYNIAMVLQSSVPSTEAATDARKFSIQATAGERLWVTYATTSATVARANAFDPTASTQTVAPFTLYTGAAGESLGTSPVCRLTSTTAMALIQVTTAAGYSVMAPVFDTSGAFVGGASPTVRRTYWTWLGGKPFVASTNPLRCYSWVYTGGARFDAPATGEQPRQYTLMLVDWGCDDTNSLVSAARPVCWVAPRIALPSSLCSVAQIAPNKWVTCGKIQRNAANRIGFARVTADFNHPGKFAGAELGQTLFIAPGFYWDRGRLAEISFAYWPQKLGTPSYTNDSGALVAGSKYRWRLVYEHVDGNGFVHRSEPSDFIEGTVAAGMNTASFAAPQLTITARQRAGDNDAPTAVRLVLYRANTATDPNTYYRVFSDYEVPVNVSRSETATIVDHGQQQLDTLYTSGGVLPNVMPQSLTAICTYRNRIWGAYGNTVIYSKAFVTGETVSFTDAFTLPLEESGDITALWVQDDTLYISTAERIYFLAADGPNDTGAMSDVPTPNRVATDLGVSDPRSVAVTPMGTIYLSMVGIQNMDRGRNVSADARVQDLVSDHPNVTSAVVHPTGRYVSLTLDDGASGTRLVYDYTVNKWSRDDVLHSGIIQSTVNVAGVQYLLVNGQPFVETPDNNRDDGSWVTMAIETAELHPVGLQGNLNFMKWTVLNEKSTDHDLKLTWFRDYATSSFQSDTVVSSTFTSPVEQISRDPQVHRGQSMRLRIEDSNPTGVGSVIGSGKGATFVGLAVEVDAADNRAYRLPANQKG